ncbi:MAG: cytochrome b [Alphaproteobacteria bacterium]|nr:cytochrome b [Alphaproteobacteria bacterium]
MTAETAPSPTPSSRYTTVAIALHWVIAVMLVSMVFYGWWMEELRDLALAGEMTFGEVQAAYNWHKTAGIIILVLSLGRLAWRLTHPVPPLPAATPGWQAFLARFTHVAFYAVMIGAPIGGWVTASSTQFPTHLFNVDALTLPRLPVPQTEGFYELAGSMHGAGGWVILILLALHAGAALKHHFIDRDGILQRMIPGLNTPPQTKG